MATIEKLLVGLGISDDGYTSGMGNAIAIADRFTNTQNGFSAWGNIAVGALHRVGEVAFDTAGRVVGALADQGTAALRAAGEYEQNLDVFQSVTDATAGQMEQLRKTAKDLGADMDLPGTSAAGAAAAMLELGKAGLSVDNVLKAAKGTLQLSAAGVGDNARAAEIAANALMAFHLEGDKATMVADQLAAVANKSSVEVADVADSFKMAASVFSAFQGTVVGNEEAMTQLNAAIGILGNVGIKGSDAGTSLKQMLLQLTGPSSVAKDQMKGLMYAAMDATGGMEGLDQVLQGKASERSEALRNMGEANPALKDMGDIAYDASGKMRPFPEIIDLVSKATKSMSDEQRNAAITSIFGADASRAVIALMQAGPAAFADMTAAITQQGAAGAAAAAQNKGLLGALDGLTSVWETLQLAMAEPLLEPLAAGIRSVGDAISAAQPTLVAFVESYLVPAAQGLASFLDGFVVAPDKIAFLTNSLAGVLQPALDAALLHINTFFSTMILRATEALPVWQAQLTSYATAAWQWIVDATPGTLAQLSAWSVSLLSGAGERLAGWQQSLLPYATAAWQWIMDAAAQLPANILHWRNAAISYVLSNLPGWLDALAPYVDAAGDWIKRSLPKLGESFTFYTVELINILGANLPSIIDKLGDYAIAFLDWITGAAPGAATETGGFVGRILDALGENTPRLVDALGRLGAKLTAWISDAIPKMQPEIVKLVGAAGDWLKERAPMIGEKVGEYAVQFFSWVAKANTDIVPKIGTLVGTVGLELVKQAPVIAKALFDGLKQGIDQQLGGGGAAIVNALTGGLYGLLTSFWGVNSPSTKMFGFAGDLYNGLWNGLSSKAGELGNNVYTWFDQNVVWKIRGLLNVFPDIGRNIANSLFGGIRDAWAGLASQLTDLWNQIPQSIRDALVMHSPSRVLTAIGKQAGQSVVGGVMQTVGAVSDAGAAIGAALSEGVGPMVVSSGVGPATVGSVGGSGSGAGRATDTVEISIPDFNKLAEALRAYYIELKRRQNLGF